MSNNNSEPNTKEGAQRQAQTDFGGGVRTDTSQWTTPQRENYETQYQHEQNRKK